VTKEELSQLGDLRKEIRELREKIAYLSKKGTRIVSDKVQASSKEFPYIETSVKISGIEYLDEKARKQKTEREILLAIRLRQAIVKEAEITAFINSVEDSGVRRLLEFRYIDGLTWEEIGRIDHCDRTTAEKKVSKYLQEHQNNEKK